MKAWDATPLKYRQYLTAEAWKWYFQIHRAVLSNRTAIHKDASYEYHALSTVMYWSRLFPLSVRRLRFAMNVAAVLNGDNAYPYPVLNVNKYDDTDADEDKYEGSTNNRNRERKHISSGSLHAMACKTEKVYYDGDLGEYGLLSKLQNQSAGDVPPVTGYYLTNVKRKSSNKVLLYLFGGAYIGGQCEADLPYATKMSQICDMDAFLPSYRLLPEHKFVDSLGDVYRAYIYLVGVRGVKPQDIVLAGLSSGAGLLVRLLQRIQEATGSSTLAPTGTDDTSTSTSTFTSSSIMPSGAVLMCPLVDFTSGYNNDESMTQYACHDLIISEAALEEVKKHSHGIGDEHGLFTESPVNRPLEGLPPLCIVVSEHETCYDQDIALCNKARRAGVSVDLGVWKYVCHGFPVLPLFLPEGRSAVDFMCKWIKDTNENN